MSILKSCQENQAQGLTEYNRLRKGVIPHLGPIQRRKRWQPGNLSSDYQCMSSHPKGPKSFRMAWLPLLGWPAPAASGLWEPSPSFASTASTVLHLTFNILTKSWGSNLWPRVSSSDPAAFITQPNMSLLPPPPRKPLWTPWTTL